MCRWPSTRKTGIVRLCVFFLLLAGTGIAAEGQAPSRAAPLLPLLTTTRQAHSMTSQQASLAYPVRLRGVVTLYDPYQEGHAALFIADATGSIFVRPEIGSFLQLHTGSFVEVTGMTDPGGFAPIVIHPKIRVVGADQPLPSPRRVTLPHLLTGAEDGQWVMIEGIVHFVEFDGMHAVLTLATDDGMVTATMVKQQNADYNRLIDSKVLISGIAGPLVDNKMQMIGVRFLVPGLDDITVEKLAPVDPFSLPLRTFDNLLTYSSTMRLQHRVHLQGRVALDWPGQTLCILAGQDGLCFQAEDQSVFREGELVDVTGFPARSNYKPTLSSVTLRRTSAPLLVSPPTRITSKEALQGDHTGELVQIEGQLIGKSMVMGHTALILSSGKTIFPALLPVASINQEGKDEFKWVVGSRILATGIYSGKVDEWHTFRKEGVLQLESFQILMRTPRDVLVLESPSWWNSQHTLTVLGLMAVLTLVVLIWVIVLRLRVEQRTQQLRQSEEKFRHLAQYDALTGLAIRSLLIERLNDALEEARQKRRSFTLLVMDVDHFKRVNDTLGHAAGDEVLRIVSKRIKATVRDTDTVARMGGDEFTVLLPGVYKTEDVNKIAAQAVANVSAPLFIRGQQVPTSISVGVTTCVDGGMDATELLHCADLAMYRAKVLGRGRYHIYSPEMAQEDAGSLRPSG
jgi:diguanylate cyclase (GGDEF)-like protein